MAINLKQISTLDTDNLKLDKVNYNFDQLVANGGGPAGVQGPYGTTGFQGITGAQGVQGTLGNQGFQGPQGNNGQGIWKVNTGGNTKTLLPIHDVVDFPARIHPPSVLIGFKSDDPEYDDSYIEENASLVVNRHTKFYNNLELRSFGVTNKFLYRLTHDNNVTTMETRFSLDGGAYNQHADLFTWSTPLSAQPLISLDSTMLDINVASDFEDLTVNGIFKIVNGLPDTGKIAVAKDVTGEIEFKSIEDIGGVVPVGTIVSVDPSFYNNSFIQTEVVPSPLNDAVVLTVGAGFGNFAGWYLCNGRTWKNSTVSYIVDDLNSFSYNIQNDTDNTNANSQGDAVLVNNKTSLIGGADSQMDATFTPGANNVPGTYSVNGTISTSPVDITSGTGINFTIKKLPQIIYLGAVDLHWQESGLGANVVLPTFVLSDWTGSVSLINNDGDTILERVLGNSPMVNLTNNIGINSTYSIISNSTSIDIKVPNGYINAGQFITGLFNINQEAAIEPNYTLTTTNNSVRTNWTLRTLNNVNAPLAQSNMSVSVLPGGTGTIITYVVPDAGYALPNLFDITWTGDTSNTEITQAAHGAYQIKTEHISMHANINSTYVFSIQASLIYYNTAQTGQASKTNCPPGQSPDSPNVSTVTKQAGSYNSIISQFNANAKAHFAATQDAQILANSSGTCSTDNTCLIEGTQVEMSNGTFKNIENILVGDNVMSFNIHTMPSNDNVSQLLTWESLELNTDESIARVTGNTESISMEIFNINNNLLKATASHLHIIKRNNVWKISKTENILVGDYLLNKDLTTTIITTIEIENEDNYKVYKLDVEDDDVYVANGIVTHNLKDPDGEDDGLGNNGHNNVGIQ